MQNSQEPINIEVDLTSDEEEPAAPQFNISTDHDYHLADGSPQHDAADTLGSVLRDENANPAASSFVARAFSAAEHRSHDRTNSFQPIRAGAESAASEDADNVEDADNGEDAGNDHDDTDSDDDADSANGVDENNGENAATIGIMENSVNLEIYENIDDPSVILTIHDNAIYLSNLNTASSNAALQSASTMVGAVENNVVESTPSPPKKRRRESTAKSATPKEKNIDNNQADLDDDGLMCSICFESWELSGEHRIASLRCGHIFGDSCLRRWLNESMRQTGVRSCPQCKTKAAVKDIRYLYAKRLRAIDRSEEHRLREQVQMERFQKDKLSLELQRERLEHAEAVLQLNQLQLENDRIKQYLRTANNSAGSSLFSFNADNSELFNLPFYKLYMERNIEISRDAGCRVMAFAERQTTLIISQKSAQSLFPGYGVRFIDTPTFRATNFLHTSAKLVRDMCLNNEHNLLAVASMENRVKVFDLRTRQMASIFKPTDRYLWACSIDQNERENFLYLGAQHGSTYVCDMRFPETIVDEFKTEDDLSPVINISPVTNSKHFPSGGFLVCKLQSVWFYEYTSANGSVTPTRLNVEGPFMSMNYDAKHETLLISARNSTRYNSSRLILGSLEKMDNIPFYKVKITFLTSKSTPVMIRSTQIAVESNTLVAGYVQDTKLLSLFDARRNQCVQSMPVCETVFDTCPVHTPNATFLAALTDSKCRIYKLVSTVK